MSCLECAWNGILLWYLLSGVYGGVHVFFSKAWNGPTTSHQSLLCPIYLDDQFQFIIVYIISNLWSMDFQPQQLAYHHCFNDIFITTENILCLEVVGDLPHLMDGAEFVQDRYSGLIQPGKQEKPKGSRHRSCSNLLVVGGEPLPTVLVYIGMWSLGPAKTPL